MLGVSSGSYGDTIKFYERMSSLHHKLKNYEQDQMNLEEELDKLKAAVPSSSHLFMTPAEEEKEKNNSSTTLNMNFTNGNASISRYSNFNEEGSKMKQERNQKILEKLQELESNALVFAARSERLKMLRREYESLIKKHRNSKGNKAILKKTDLANTRDDNKKFCTVGVNTNISGPVKPISNSSSEMPAGEIFGSAGGAVAEKRKITFFNGNSNFVPSALLNRVWETNVGIKDGLLLEENEEDRRQRFLKENEEEEEEVDRISKNYLDLSTTSESDIVENKKKNYSNKINFEDTFTSDTSLSLGGPINKNKSADQTLSGEMEKKKTKFFGGRRGSEINESLSTVTSIAEDEIEPGEEGEGKKEMIIGFNEESVFEIDNEGNEKLHDKKENELSCSNSKRENKKKYDEDRTDRRDQLQSDDEFEVEAGNSFKEKAAEKVVIGAEEKAKFNSNKIESNENASFIAEKEGIFQMNPFMFHEKKKIEKEKTVERKEDVIEREDMDDGKIKKGNEEEEAFSQQMESNSKEKMIKEDKEKEEIKLLEEKSFLMKKNDTKSSHQDQQVKRKPKIKLKLDYEDSESSEVSEISGTGQIANNTISQKSFNGEIKNQNKLVQDKGNNKEEIKKNNDNNDDDFDDFFDI